MHTHGTTEKKEIIETKKQVTQLTQIYARFTTIFSFMVLLLVQCIFVPDLVLNMVIIIFGIVASLEDYD